jgi:mannitol/fructose-specific phosphotransferase system IIA component (Ntr-type)
MSLAELLSADQIIPEMKATERWDAIVELMDLLVARGQIKPEDRDGILASLKQREETMSTGIGFGIAIPHCSSDRLDKVVAAFGRSSTGIEFDALDNAPVKFRCPFYCSQKSVSDPSPHARLHRKILERSQRARSARQRHFGGRNYFNFPRPSPGNGVSPSRTGGKRALGTQFFLSCFLFFSGGRKDENVMRPTLQASDLEVAPSQSTLQTRWRHFRRNLRGSFRMHFRPRGCHSPGKLRLRPIRVSATTKATPRWCSRNSRGENPRKIAENVISKLDVAEISERQVSPAPVSSTLP